VIILIAKEMEDVLTVVLFLFAEVIFFRICYSIGWVTLKILSFGKIRIETKRIKWNERRSAGEDYHFSDIQAAIFGFFIMVALIAFILSF
jgi:hypothetical protein